MRFQLQLEMCGFFILDSMPPETVLWLVTTKGIYLNLISIGIGKTTQDWILIEIKKCMCVCVSLFSETEKLIKMQWSESVLGRWSSSVPSFELFQIVIKCHSKRKLLQNVRISLFSRFNLVQRTGTASTAIAYSLRRRSEFLVGMADYSLKCFDTGQ